MIPKTAALKVAAVAPGAGTTSIPSSIMRLWPDYERGSSMEKRMVGAKEERELSEEAYQILERTDIITTLPM